MRAESRGKLACLCRGEAACSVVAHEALMRAVPSLRDIVDFMRKHKQQFPVFWQSDTHKLFEPPIFENKKKASGYFSNSQRVERSE